MNNTTNEQHDDFVDITAELQDVTGGGALGAIWKGAKATYNAVRPVLKETADVVKDLGVIGGVGYGAKKAWDWATGNNQPAQPQQPQQPAQGQ
jgi:hypothetical protein